MFNTTQIFDDVVLGQYKLSPKFAAVLQQIIDAHDISTDIATIHSVCFDLDTAVGVWLDLLGKKIGLSRILKVPVHRRYFGFAGDSLATGFGQMPFFSRKFADYTMNDDQYRAALKIKAEGNYLSANVQNMNYLLRKYFNRTDCYVQFHGVMRMKFWFLWDIADWEKSLVPLIIPIPAAVSFSFAKPSLHFGFAGDSMATGFEQKPFRSFE